MISSVELIHHEPIQDLPDPRSLRVSISAGDDIPVVGSISEHDTPLGFDTTALAYNTEDLLVDHYVYSARESIFEEGYESSTTYIERNQEIAEALEKNGELPIAHGFSFVTDRRPAGQEDTKIPSYEYTRYFSEGKVPIAPKDHNQHSHDKYHAGSYESMFSVAAFAAMVRAAATNALADPALCSEFTGAMDHLGDGHRNLTSGFRLQGNVQMVERNLTRLIKLASPDATLEEQTALHASLMNQLELDTYANRLRERTLAQSSAPGSLSSLSKIALQESLLRGAQVG